MGMSAREALYVAIELMEQQPETQQNKETLKQLNKLLSKDIFVNWSKEMIIDTLDDWAKKNGRPPTVSNLVEPGMPKSITIKKHFGVSASVFLKQHFDIKDKKTRINKYGFIHEDDWLRCFIFQFNKHQPNSKTYNKLKDSTTPNWETIARHCNCTKWGELMNISKVQYSDKNIHNNAQKVNVVSATSPWLEKYNALVSENKKINNELIDVIINKKNK